MLFKILFDCERIDSQPLYSKQVVKTYYYVYILLS